MGIPRNWRLRNQRYRLVGSQCPQCQNLFFPPRQVCPHCYNSELSEFVFSGKGSVYSFTVLYQTTPKFEFQIPYIVALIDLNEGPRITAQLTDVDAEEVRIGMPVEMVVRKISEENERGLIHYGYKFRPIAFPESE
ncbi:MAG: Zn-ribbon domain-containing OB-fold protein [Calditrichaeota bacterium]|nr:MAG: Zn-ribbon domain-containing OB-fold protein [Calditrichota bacterium]